MAKHNYHSCHPLSAANLCLSWNISHEHRTQGHCRKNFFCLKCVVSRRGWVTALSNSDCQCPHGLYETQCIFLGYTLSLSHFCLTLAILLWRYFCMFGIHSRSCRSLSYRVVNLHKPVNMWQFKNGQMLPTGQRFSSSGPQVVLEWFSNVLQGGRSDLQVISKRYTNGQCSLSWMRNGSDAQ